MRISYLYKDWENVFDRELNQVIIGRPRLGVTPGPDLDLTPDQTVSRPHARIWIEDGKYWIEDLGSTHGTQLNGNEIKSKGRQHLISGDSLRIGETMLRVDVPPSPAPRPGAASGQPTSKGQGLNGQASNGQPAVAERTGEINYMIPGAVPLAEPAGAIAASLDATKADAEALLKTATADATRQMGLLYELLLQCGTAASLDSLLQTVVERLVEVIPHAARGALLLRGRDNDALLLKAFRSAEGPVVSETLGRRAMREGIGFIWRRDETQDIGGSIAHYRIETGMYAPLLWQGQALGVICVDNPTTSSIFSQDDLRLLMTVAHYLAMAMANQQLQEDLRRETSLKANLLRQFSPQVAEQLMTHGTLQLSGERSEVTILCSDIRGFANLTKDMEPIEVVELLNDYFSRLIPIIFAHNGTVDKYIGDAILAVFGSPKKDPQQHENALRAALGMQAEMAKSNAARAAKGKVTCNIGIGIHCGEVLHGFIGVADRMELTVIGEAVNRASRYCDGARGGEVLISPQIYQWVWKTVEAEPTTILTKHEGGLSAFRLINFKALQE